ncbi:hypothetical protein ASZ90_015358 [hydrocarbon metagenome]|uniref:Ycfa family protein n=1 Tax=hydrocarbon metagenome TaxID=938273 RepID=A0A0W8F286_9ZZZZ
MKLPRDVGGDDLVRRLTLIGYERVHQTGSHVRIRAIIDGKPHTITIPRNNPLRVGTFHHIPKRCGGASSHSTNPTD